jgi:hypothetical protein
MVYLLRSSVALDQRPALVAIGLQTALYTYSLLISSIRSRFHSPDLDGALPSCHSVAATNGQGCV